VGQITSFQSSIQPWLEKRDYCSNLCEIFAKGTVQMGKNRGQINL